MHFETVLTPSSTTTSSRKPAASKSKPKPAAGRPKTNTKKKLTAKRKIQALTNPNIPIDNECRLLDLAAELRNTIFEYVLLDKNKIVITKKTFRKPALLRTCKQIQNEAGPIYYGPENKFGFVVKNYDALTLKHFCIASQGLWRGSPPKFSMRMGWSCLNWSKLLNWLEAYHKGEMPFYQCKVGCTGLTCCDGDAAAKIVETLPTTLDWDTVILPVLEVHKRTVERGRGAIWKLDARR